MINQHSYRILLTLYCAGNDNYLIEIIHPGANNLSPEDFERFLRLLSPDSDEAGRRYSTLHKKLTGFFSMKGVGDPGSAADETIDRAVLKIAAGAVVSDVGKYCLGIARHIFQERLRLVRREASAFQEFIAELSRYSGEQVERIYSILKPCFELLAADERQLLLVYCQKVEGRARAVHRRQLADTRKITLLALRVRVTRLRDRLTDCVRKRSNDVENSAAISNKQEISSILL